MSEQHHCNDTAEAFYLSQGHASLDQHTV